MSDKPSATWGYGEVVKRLRVTEMTQFEDKGFAACTELALMIEKHEPHLKPVDSIVQIARDAMAIVLKHDRRTGRRLEREADTNTKLLQAYRTGDFDCTPLIEELTDFLRASQSFGDDSPNNRGFSK